MNHGPAAFLFQMPSARQLFNVMLADLRQGRSILVLLPDGVDPTLLLPDLLDGLENINLYMQEIFIPELDSQSPVASLGASLGVTWSSSNTPRTVENLAKNADLPDVLILDGFDELNQEDRIRWLNLMVQWAQVCQGRRSTSEDDLDIPPALCLVTQASNISYPPPQSNVLLAIRVWWGIPTTLEMQLLCQLAAEQDTSPSSRWKEYTIPAIVGSDLNLADYLWAAEYRNNGQLTHELRSYAQKRGWEQTGIKDWPVHVLPQNNNASFEAWQFSRSLYDAWARGLVHWTPEYGLEPHSGILALLDQQETLDHRLWRGQARFLLSEIDKTRLALCAHLNRLYGDDWPYKWKEPVIDREFSEVKITPFACQWGHLKSLLRSRQELNKERCWLSLVNRSWHIRTQLAHYRPITLNDYEAFRREVKRGHRAGMMTV